MMKFDVLSRFTGKVLFTAEIETDSTVRTVQLGLAVKWALTNGANLSGARLSGADLSGADLSDADLSGARLIGADLSDADLSGARLRDARLIGADLSGANLSGARLSGADLIGADLSGARLSGADLSDADLSGARLRDARLSGADLIGARLSDADLSDADWVPKIPKIHTAVFEAASAEGALDMGYWHGEGGFCGTTHCRAGWVTHLAGEDGKALEDRYSTSAAAALIYAASDPTLERTPDFHADNETAMADMKRLAELEAAQCPSPTTPPAAGLRNQEKE